MRNDGFDTFESLPETDDIGTDKQEVTKVSIIIVVIGLAVIIVAFMIMRALSNKAVGVKKEYNNKNTVNDVYNNSKTGENIGSGRIKDNINESSWVEFSTTDGEIRFDEEYVDCIFTIIDIRHFVKVVDNEGGLALKSILSGNLSGFMGIYELNIPYSKGVQLKRGNKFEVVVELGEYGNKVVVGEINY